MRVREVMSSPVVTVPPDLRLKEVADLLVSHRIGAVPVVEDGELVGIVSEADLVALQPAGPAGGPGPQRRGDRHRPGGAAHRRAWAAEPVPGHGPRLRGWYRLLAPVIARSGRRQEQDTWAALKQFLEQHQDAGQVPRPAPAA